MTQQGYFHDMSILDGRLTLVETRLDKLETVVKKILNLLEEMKEWQLLQSHSE